MSTNTPPPVPQGHAPTKPSKSLWMLIWDFLTSFKLAVALLGLSTITVFLGTVAQVSQGLYEAQERWFKSWWFIKKASDPDWMNFVPIFPGGYLLGTLFLINMLCAHFRRLKSPPGGWVAMLGHYLLVYGVLLWITLEVLWYPVWLMVALLAVICVDLVASRKGNLAGSGRKLGVDMTHLGLAVLMIGQLLTDKLAEETHMTFKEGETKAYTERHMDVELAFAKDAENNQERQITIPSAFLKDGAAPQTHADLPFSVKVSTWMPNADLVDREEAEKHEGTMRQAMARLEAEYGVAENLPQAAAKALDNPGRLAVWQAALREVGLPTTEVEASAKQAAADHVIAPKLMELLKTKFRAEMTTQFMRQGGAMGFAAAAVSSGKTVAEAMPKPQATSTVAQRYFVVPLPEAKDMDTRNMPAAVIELEDKNGKAIGSWLVSNLLKDQVVAHEGTDWRVSLRAQRRYLPYTVKLLKTTHDVYQGTDTPKDFRSNVLIENPVSKETREVEIFMNSPLRYQKLTYFQHQMSREEKEAGRGISTLQVVENPASFSPYYGCVLVSYGLCRHFMLHLIGFLTRGRRKKEEKTAETPTAPETSSPLLWLAPVLALFMALWPASHWLRGPKLKHETLAEPIKQMGALPVVHRGREQPLDSLARNSLLILRKKQILNCEPWKGEFGGPKMISALEWLLEVALEPEVAADRPAFRVDNDDVKGLLHLPKEPNKEAKLDGKHYTWNQIKLHFASLRRETQRATAVNSKLRTAYDNALVNLWEAVDVYQKLGALFGPASQGSLAETLPAYKQKITDGRAAFSARMEGQEHSVEALDWVQSAFGAPLIVPPHRPEAGKQNIWLNAMQTVAGAAPEAAPHAVLQGYSDIAAAYLKKDAEAMSKGVISVRDGVSKEVGADAHALRKGPVEQKFNHVEPFYKASVLCMFAMLCGFASWFGRGTTSNLARLTGWWLVFVAMVLLTIGLITRMWLEGRPPVTSLYSSAIFIGWGATLFGLFFERIWPYSVALVASAIIGFLTLLVAHFLALDGDTMVMLQAVLDTNIWLATHVVVVTLGYVATFVAGFIGILYIFRLLIARITGIPAPERFGRVCALMVFAITCFGVLFSFVGTVLGGIWADQSWGRFWGWDPKENGALMIVLWNALILHARLGGLVKERGLMNLAIIGNIVTAWSWFGTNQLSIGLHSYGFTSAAATALNVFIAANLIVVLFSCFLRPKAENA